MTPEDHSAIGQSIARAMRDDGMIKEVVEQIIPPILEAHKREIIRENAGQLRTMARQNGFDCDDVFENQKDLAHLRTDRVEKESNVRKVKEWGFGITLAGLAAMFGMEKLL